MLTISIEKMMIMKVLEDILTGMLLAPLRMI